MNGIDLDQLTLELSHATPTLNVGEFILSRGKATGIEFKVLKHRGKIDSSDAYHIQPYPLDVPLPTLE